MLNEEGYLVFDLGGSHGAPPKVCSTVPSQNCEGRVVAL